MNKLMDPTMLELKMIKAEIQKFVDDIFQPNSEHMKNYFINICKKIVLTKYLIRYLPEDHRYKSLQSDLCYLLNSIENGEIRYYYLNIRSIIEQGMRIVADVKDTSTMTNFVLMEKVVEIKNSLNQNHLINIGVIQDEYSKSCLYVHGNSNAQIELADYYINAFHQSKVISGLDTKLSQLISLLKSIFNLLLMNQAEIIDGAFHRRKSILRYLVSDNRVVDYIIAKNE